MELRHLRYFVAVAEAGSLTVAAQQRIRDLESELGAQLLARRARGIELTPAGRTFLDHARLVLSQVDAASEAARRVAHPSKPCFTIGFLTGHELKWMPEALRILRDELPNIDVMVSSQYSPLLADGLSKGTIDAAFLRRERGIPELAYRVLVKEPLMVVRSGSWQKSVGQDLSGKVLGVVGLGNIGGQVARIGLAFGMKIIAWSQNMTPEIAEAAGARLVSKDELFRQADIVTIHLILSGRTKGLVGAAELRLMKPTSRLINTSRGPIVDEPSLIKALKSHAIAGAAIDVFDEEPLPAQHPFRSMDNVLATPHIGYVSESLYRAF
jgi:hypothetical protein